MRVFPCTQLLAFLFMLFKIRSLTFDILVDIWWVGQASSAAAAETVASALECRAGSLGHRLPVEGEREEHWSHWMAEEEPAWEWGALG